MNRKRLWAKGLATAALLAGLYIGGSAFSMGQELAVAPAADAPPAAVPMPEAAPQAMPAEPAGEIPPGVQVVDPPADQPASIWSKVPPPIAPVRIGYFFILPTGPGYYSLKDLVCGTYRENPPIYPRPPYGICPMSNYDANYRYLDNPDNTQTDLLDPVKRIHIGDNWLLSFGGEERIRYANEVDSRLSGKNNVYELERSRIYGDLWYRDIFRVYVEYIDAQTSNQDLPPSATDINKSDFLNLFVDLKLAELADNPLYVRGGRQEMYYGSQRLISQIDWPNTRRSFDAVKGFWHSEDLDVDAFWSRPIVPVNPDRFDSENDKETFDGLWTTYRPMKGQAIDAYYLYLDNTTPLAGVRTPTRHGFDVNTFGSRYSGDYNILLWDFEGMYQFGEHGAQSTSAGAYTTALGMHCGDVPMNPQFWVTYDFASGNDHPGVGQYGTFNQLFPNGHAFFGGTDLIGRQNIEDFNLAGYVYPVKWVTVSLQYHILRLDSARDSLYNAAGTAIRTSPTGAAGTDVGDVLTLYTNFHLGPHSDLLLQYSHLYSGTFIKDTGSPLSPDEFYLQYSFRW